MALIFPTRRACRSSVQCVVRKVSTISCMRVASTNFEPRVRTLASLCSRALRAAASSVAGRGAHARHLVGGHGRPDAGAVDQDAQPRVARADRARHGQRDVGIVHGLGREGAQVVEAVAQPRQVGLDLFLEREAAVVGAEGHHHGRRCAAGPCTMRTPREAAISRAQGVTIAPGAAETSPPGGTDCTSSAVTRSFMAGAADVSTRPRGVKIAGGMRRAALTIVSRGRDRVGLPVHGSRAATVFPDAPVVLDLHRHPARGPPSCSTATPPGSTPNIDRLGREGDRVRRSLQPLPPHPARACLDAHGPPAPAPRRARQHRLPARPGSRHPGHALPGRRPAHGRRPSPPTSCARRPGSRRASTSTTTPSRWKAARSRSATCSATARSPWTRSRAGSRPRRARASSRSSTSTSRTRPTRRRRATPGHALPYDGEVAYADELVGRLIASLEASGLYDRAIVAVTSDHGEGLGDHGEAEHGIFLYREAVHVPLDPAAAPRRARRAPAWRARWPRPTSRPPCSSWPASTAEGLDGVSLRAALAGAAPPPAIPSTPRRSTRATTSAGASCSRPRTAATATCARRGRSCSTSRATRREQRNLAARARERGRGHEPLAGAAGRGRRRVRAGGGAERRAREAAGARLRGLGRRRAPRPARCPIPRTTSRPTRTSRRGLSLRLAGRREEAVAQLRKVVARQPRHARRLGDAGRHPRRAGPQDGGDRGARPHDRPRSRPAPSRTSPWPGSSPSTAGATRPCSTPRSRPRREPGKGVRDAGPDPARPRPAGRGRGRPRGAAWRRTRSA